MANGKCLIIYKKILILLLALGIIAIPSYWYYDIYTRIPAVIRIHAGQEQNINLKVPVSGELYQKKEDSKIIQTTAVPAESIHVQLDKEITIAPTYANQYQMNLKLFGMIPFKNVDLQVIQDISLIPAGIPIGIYVKTEGVLVIDTGKFKDLNGDWQQPAEHILQGGDYIEKVNGIPVTSKKDFINCIAACGGKEMILTVLRGEETIDVKIEAVQNENGEYKVGLWIRDSAQGIGTLTYIDNKNKFGALGHGINDIDTSELMDLNYGTLYTTKILSVTPGKSGVPGEITGVIQYEEENILGEISANTRDGIFGNGNEQLVEQLDTTALPIGLKQEIQIGPAEIVCTIDDTTKSYQVNITKVDYTAKNSNRGILLEVTDPELLLKTGGIIQGMSGAPIIQNGKIIGAVTHVLVQDATKGYGVFIENMLESQVTGK